MRFTRVCHAAARGGAGSRIRRGAGARALERIRQVEAADQAALAAHRALDALSLSSAHGVHELERLAAAAQVSEVPAADGGSTWLLHHAAAPGARIAELRLLPAVPAALGGRFDAGLRGGAGLGPTLHGAAVHRGLPLSTAAPLIAHALDQLRRHSVAERSSDDAEEQATRP